MQQNGWKGPNHDRKECGLKNQARVRVLGHTALSVVLCLVTAQRTYPSATAVIETCGLGRQCAYQWRMQVRTAPFVILHRGAPQEHGIDRCHTKEGEKRNQTENDIDRFRV